MWWPEDLRVKCFGIYTSKSCFSQEFNQQHWFLYIYVWRFEIGWKDIFGGPEKIFHLFFDLLVEVIEKTRWPRIYTVRAPYLSRMKPVLYQKYRKPRVFLTRTEAVQNPYLCRTNPYSKYGFFTSGPTCSKPGFLARSITLHGLNSWKKDRSEVRMSRFETKLQVAMFETLVIATCSMTTHIYALYMQHSAWRWLVRSRYSVWRGYR